MDRQDVVRQESQTKRIGKMKEEEFEKMLWDTEQAGWEVYTWGKQASEQHID